MQPLGKSTGGSSTSKCSEVSSKCVIWDGPNLDCLGISLCKGDSIDIVVYNTALVLCKLLETFNINTVDLQCLATDGINSPQNIVELTQLIITKLCNLNDEVVSLQSVGTIPIYVPLPDCDDIIASCPSQDANGDPITLSYEDANGNTVTSLLLISADGTTSPVVEYFAKLICELLCRMTTAESEIADLRDDVDNLINQAAGALPSVQVPACVNNNINPQPMVDPNNPLVGAIPDMAVLLCDIKTALVDGNSIATLTNFNINSNVACNNTIDTATPLGAYPLMSPQPGTLGDLGAIANADTVQEVLTNMWVAICDLRNFATIVKNTCCPTLCTTVTWDIAAGLPISSGGSRDFLDIILTGSFVDWYGSTQIANSSIPNPPGFGAGPPAQNNFDGNHTYTTTITDQHGNTATFTGSPVSNLFTPGNAISLTNLTTGFGPNPGLDALDNWSLNFSGYIIAPDYSVCNYSLDLTIPAICDIQPLSSVTVQYVGYDGVTIQYAPPTSPSWPASGTICTDFEIEIYNSTTNALLDTVTLPYGVYSNYQIFLYGSPDSVLPLGICTNGCANYIQTDKLQPNTSFYLKVRLLYNCGSSAQVVTTPFKTYIPIEITLNQTADSACTFGGDFTLVPDTSVGPFDGSANFSSSNTFIPGQPNVVTVYAKEGTTFGFLLNTPYINPAAAAQANGVNINTCTTNTGVRCWGPPALYKYQTGGTSAPYFADLENQYAYEGCFDYIISQLGGDLSYLGYGAGQTFIDNIVNTGGAPSQPGSASQSFDNSPTAPGYIPLTIPSGYDPLTNSNPIQISVTPQLHIINGGSNPTLKIVIKDSVVSGNQYLANNGLIYFPASTALNTLGVPVGIPITMSYNPMTISYLSLGGYITGRPTSWTSVFTAPTNNPVGVPVFLKISIYKWVSGGSGGGSYVLPPNNTYYVTSDWLNAGLPNITGTGFIMNGTGLQLRDKIRIEWSSGVENNNNNPDYQSTGPVIGPTNQSYGKVTITQDPYPGAIGPFVACDVKTGTTFNSAKAGVLLPPYGTGVPLWGNTTIYPGAQYATAGTNKSIEFVITADTTITWEVDDNAFSC